jgi:LuxR family maltose regulon positive regulatory protein
MRLSRSRGKPTLRSLKFGRLGPKVYLSPLGYGRVVPGNTTTSPTITNTYVDEGVGTGMTRATARVDGDTLVLDSNDESPIMVGTPAWFAWLESATTFVFTSPSGKFTARKEGRARGGMYWKAYHTSQGTLHRAYLGKTSDLTLDRLAKTAAALATASSSTAESNPPTLAARSSPAPVAPPAAPPSLLATKLNVPAARAQLVVRSRLFERLEAGVQGKLTLIAAPAGFGKTTLLSAWRTTATGSDMPFAWVSLDQGDNDPLLFWRYVLAAIDTVAPGAATSAMALLQSPQPPPIEHILTSVLNTFTALSVDNPARSVALVLEDYHAITAPAIHEALSWLVDSLPPALHLVIVTRADPTLPLARLRARGDLTEIHAEDLRFTPDEGAAFLNQVMGLALPSGDLAALEVRTEGWIAGLQLAALALRDNRDRTGFIRTFSGNNRYIVDYLASEVFERQPAHVQAFLLHTSILDRMCGPLCDGFLDLPTESEDHNVNNVNEMGAKANVSVARTFSDTSSQGILEELERANLFVVPLDEDRRWYRYHHLFADVLRQRLTRSVSGAAISALHERASVWYEGQGLLSEAIRHALMMWDASRAAQLLERHGLGVIVGGQVQTAMGWLDELPEELLLAHPRLCIYYALALLFTNNLPAAEARLEDAERYIRPDTPPAEAQSIQGYSAAIRANIALYTGDLAGCVANGEQVLRLLPDTETELIARTTARLHVARAFRVTGDVTVASERRAAAALAPIRATGSLFGSHGAVANLALLQELQGRLHAAAATYREVDQLGSGRDDLQGLQAPKGLQGLHGISAYYVGLGDLHREWNELDAADGYMAQAMELLPNTLTVDAEYVVRGYMALARLQHARGQHAAAQETLATYSELAQRRGFVPHLITRAAAMRAQIALASGDLTAAVTWVAGSGLRSDDEIAFRREAEYLALARVWIAQAGSGAAGDYLPQAFHLLDRLMVDASEKARYASVLEILIVRALALEAQGNRPDAQATIMRALTLAAPEGYVRRFVDEGPAMLNLLQAFNAAVDTGSEAETAALVGVRSYIRLLLAAFAGQSVTLAGAEAGSVPMSQTVPSPALYDRLSERELEVLRLIATGQSNSEIAQALVIALSTVKTHTNTIFGKLGVSSRTQAVARARDLQLI